MPGEIKTDEEKLEERAKSGFTSVQVETEFVD